MRFTGISILKVENGLITEELGLDDGVTVLQQLGLSFLAFSTPTASPSSSPRRSPTPGVLAGVSRVAEISGADDGIRTRDPHLGKVMLYQLSHVRVSQSL